MGDYSELKTAISSAIKTNGNGEITGEVLQSALLSIVSTIGENATFAGIATPDTSPGVPDQNVFYLATQPGVYNNFRRGMTLPEGLSIIYTNGSVWSFTILVQEATTENAGLMSAADKVALENKATKDLVTTESDGLMSKEDKGKLDSIGDIDNLVSIKFDDRVTDLPILITAAGYAVKTYGDITSVFHAKKGDRFFVDAKQWTDTAIFSFSKTIPTFGDTASNILLGKDHEQFNSYVYTSPDDGYVLFTHLFRDNEITFENFRGNSSVPLSAISSLNKSIKAIDSLGEARANFRFISLSADDASDKSEWTIDDVINNIYEPMRLAHPEYITRKSLGKDSSGLYDIWCYEFDSSVNIWLDRNNVTNFYSTKGNVHLPSTNGLSEFQCEIKKSLFDAYKKDNHEVWLESVFEVEKSVPSNQEIISIDGVDWVRFTCQEPIKTINVSGKPGVRIWWAKPLKTFDQHAVIMAGTHADEFAGILGVALALKYLVENHTANSALDYIYNSVKLSVIPCLNPWGANQNPKVRTNFNGAQMNRYTDPMTAEHEVLTSFISSIKDEISFFIDFHTAEHWANYGYVYAITEPYSKLYPAIVSTANFLCKHWFPNSPALNWNIGRSSTEGLTNAKYMADVLGVESSTIEFTGRDLEKFGACTKWSAKYMTYCIENYINYLMACCNAQIKSNSKNLVYTKFFSREVMS